MSTRIEWADSTWNPIIGCSKVSPGCDNCYAERMAFRQTKMRPHGPYDDVIHLCKGWNGKTRFVPEALDKPLHWRKPQRIFVCSMGDIAHETVPFHDTQLIFDLTRMAPQHTYLFLTKRPHLLATHIFHYFDGHRGGTVDIPPNWHIGVTAENQEQADKRIPILLSIPAAVRFVSIEPMLGPVDLGSIAVDMGNGLFGDCLHPHHVPYEGGKGQHRTYAHLNHVIVGGESGPGARPMHPDWAKSVQMQCEAAEVPFLFKQWGEWVQNCLCGRPTPCRTIQRPSPGLPGVMFRCGKAKSGRELYGRTWDQYPEVPA